MKKSLKKTIPSFSSEQEERQFWEKEDSIDYIDWEKAQKTSFPNLKKSSKSISIRLPEDMLERLKIEANKIDVPYQSLIKMILHEALEKRKNTL